MKLNKPKDIPQEISEYISYNYDTGELSVKKRNGSSKLKVGHIYNGKDKNGYIIVEFNHKAYKAHRIAYFLHYGKQPGKLIDHINGSVSDNRICNLRVATYSENTRNTAKHRSGKYVGVLIDKRNKTNPYKARTMLNGTWTYIGVFKCEHQAAQAVAMYESGEYKIRRPKYEENKDKNKRSIYQCVYLDKNKKSERWTTRKYVDGKYMSFGSFECEHKAAMAIAMRLGQA